MSANTGVGGRTLARAVAARLGSAGARAAAALIIAAVVAGAGRVDAAGPLDPTLADKLATSTYVYVSSERKDGSFSKPAEIWFLWHDGAVWVGTPPTTWRVKRIKAKRPTARIAVGNADGPSFLARGAIVDDPKVAELMFTTYAKKYPDRWPGYAERFRTGMKDGSRVLVRYTPIAEAKGSPAPAVHTPGLDAPEPTRATPRIEDRAGEAPGVGGA